MWRNDAIYTSTRTSSDDQEFLKDESCGDYCSRNSSSGEDEETQYCLQHEEFDYCSRPRSRGEVLHRDSTGTASSLHMDGTTTSSYSDLEEAISDRYFYYPHDLHMEGGFSQMSMSNASLVEAADIIIQSKHDDGYLGPSSELDEADEVLMACQSHRQATESALYPDPIDLDFYPNDSSFTSSQESQWEDLVEPKLDSIRRRPLMVDNNKNQEANEEEKEESRPESLGASKIRIQPADHNVKVDYKILKLRKCLASSTLDFLSRVEIIQSTLRELYTREQGVQRTCRNGDCPTSSPPRLGFSEYNRSKDAEDPSADCHGLKLAPAARTGLITCHVGDLQIAKQSKTNEADGDQGCNISIKEIFRPCAAERGTSQNHFKSYSSSWRGLESGYKQQQHHHHHHHQDMKSHHEQGDGGHTDNISRSHVDCSTPLPGGMYIVDYFKNPAHTCARVQLKTHMLELEAHVRNLCTKPCGSAILQNVSESAMNGQNSIAGGRAPTLAEDGEHLRELAKTCKPQQLLHIISRLTFPDENENPRETNQNTEEKTGGIFETSKGTKTLDDALSTSNTMSMPGYEPRLQEICQGKQAESRFCSLDDIKSRSKTLGVPSFRSVETSQEKQQESSLALLERDVLHSIKEGQIALRKTESIPVAGIKSTEDFHGSACDSHMVHIERSAAIEQYKDANAALIADTSESESNPRNSIQSQIKGLGSYANLPLPSNELMTILHNWQHQYQMPPAECYPSSNKGPIDESYSRNKSTHTRTVGMVDHTPQSSYLSQYVKTQARRTHKSNRSYK